LAGSWLALMCFRKCVLSDSVSHWISCINISLSLDVCFERSWWDVTKTKNSSRGQTFKSSNFNINNYLIVRNIPHFI